MTQQVVAILALALAVATVSMTVTKSKIFKPFRGWLDKKSEWIGELFSCPYCFGHWAALVAVTSVRPIVTNSGLFIVDLGVSWLAVTGLSALICGLIYKSMASMG